MMRTKEVDVLEQVQSKDTARRSIQLSRSLNLQNLSESQFLSFSFVCAFGQNLSSIEAGWQIYSVSF